MISTSTVAELDTAILPRKNSCCLGEKRDKKVFFLGVSPSTGGVVGIFVSGSMRNRRAPFVEDDVDWDIVGFSGECGSTADRIGQTHRSMGDLRFPQEREKAIVVAPSVAQAVAIFVKGQGGDQDEGVGQVLARQRRAGLVRLGDAEAGGGETGVSSFTNSSK